MRLQYSQGYIAYHRYIGVFEADCTQVQNRTFTAERRASKVAFISVRSEDGTSRSISYFGGELSKTLPSTSDLIGRLKEKGRTMLRQFYFQASSTNNDLPRGLDMETEQSSYA